jgi:hypothetical protein
MATNYKALALMLPAAKVIVTSGVDLPERMVLTVVLVLITSIPAWLPVILEVVLPGSMDRIIGAIKHFLDRFGHRILVALLALLGAFLTVRGAILVAGL